MNHIPVTDTRAIQATRRALIQAAKFAIRDIYDALAELITNADDRYQILGKSGRIEIEVERRRGKGHSLRVRDFADGMDNSIMDTKLSRMGGRDSGLAIGAEVRGTHSRGAKDIAALGRVTFESIAQDGMYHKCAITPYLDFEPPSSEPATPVLREALGLTQGTGTVVTIELDDTVSIPHHDNLKSQLQKLVVLRGVFTDPKRSVILRDLGKIRDDELTLPRVEGTERLNERIQIPGYPGAEAKLSIIRARRRFEREPDRFRLGGIQIVSRHAVHEATLFDSGLENEPHAMWFMGRLVCPYIDDLCNDFDDRFEQRQPPSEANPKYPLDPSRKTGLNREHPFVRSLFGEALKRLRPLVEEERAREERDRANIENDDTKKRLSALARAALEFMRDFEDEDEPARDPDGMNPESRFMERGVAISPPFAQIVKGHSRQFWLTVKQDVFPELSIGSGVQIECLSGDIESDRRVCGLEEHPTRKGVLRAIWKVNAVRPTPATGVRVHAGPISIESAVEVLESEADLYRHVTSLQFSRKRYGVPIDGKRKKLRVLAPITTVPDPTQLHVEIDSSRFRFSGECLMKPHQDRSISICDLTVESDGKEASGVITVRLSGEAASAVLIAEPPRGADLSIKLVDLDLGNQRSKWKTNLLQIAARHPSLRRYLGDSQQGFPGQNTRQFRVLTAEIVADAICARLVRRNVEASPEEFEEADWDQYYALYSKYMTAFLPKAHQLVCPEG